MRKRTLLTFSLVVVVFLSGFSATANAAFVTLTGSITDSVTGNPVTGVLVTAYPTITCGSWTGTAALTNITGHYSMSVPDDCNFYIYPTRKNYTFYPVYYYVTPSIVHNEFNFIGIQE